MGKQESQANHASPPTSMLDLESPITGSNKVRTSSRLEPAYASPSLQRAQRGVREKLHPVQHREAEARPLPKNGSNPHGVAVVEDIVRQEGQGRVTLIFHP